MADLQSWKTQGTACESGVKDVWFCATNPSEQTLESQAFFREWVLQEVTIKLNA